MGISQVLPLGLGLLLRRWQPQIAERIESPLSKLAELLLLVIIVAVLWKTGPLLVPFLRAELVGLALCAGMVLLSLGIGFAFSGPAPKERTTISLLTSMRNPGLALLFAGLYAPAEPSIKLAIIGYLLMTILLSIPFLRWRQQLIAPHPMA